VVPHRGTGRAGSDTPPEPRLYRVGRIEIATTLDDRAVRPPDLNVERLWQTLRRRFERDRGPGVAVRLAVTAERLDMLVRLVAPQLVGPVVVDDPADGRGRRLVSMPFVAAGAAEGVLLGFGPDVEILDPPELRESFRRTAAAVVALYDGPDSTPSDRAP
jgi:predicted DNA-binding transcriptional regulator YafY